MRARFGLFVFFALFILLFAWSVFGATRHPVPHIIRPCRVHGALPDMRCTPGATFPGVTREQVCQPGYARKVRQVSERTKASIFLSYGVTRHTTGEYEIDHLISLELGGSNEVANLWPEAANPRPGFHEKDVVEGYLHRQVCTNNLPLQEAQREIATNWLAVYQRLPT
jgi:hypothetical protein